MSSDSFYQRQPGPGRKRRRALVIDAAGQPPPRPAVSADAKPSDLARKSLKRFAMVVGCMILLMFLSVKLLEHVWLRRDEERTRTHSTNAVTDGPAALLSAPRSLPTPEIPPVSVTMLSRASEPMPRALLNRGQDDENSDAAHTAEKKFRWGKILEQHGEAEGALDLYQQAIALAPVDALMLSQAGRMYIRLLRHAEAIPVLRRALAADPTDPGIMNDLGVALTFDGQAAEAVVLYDGLAEQHPDYPAARFNKAYALVQLGRLDEARPLLERFIQTDGGNAMAHGLLAVIEQSAGNRERALALLDHAISLAPNWGTPYLDAAALLASQRDFFRAADYLERALAVASPADIYHMYKTPAFSDLRASPRGKELESRIADRARALSPGGAKDPE